MLKQIPTLDSFSWQPPIISILNTPPVGPSKGDRYIVGEGTGDWSGQDNDIAWYDTAWNFTLATDGMTVFDMSANSYLTFDVTSNSWVNNSDLYLKLDQTTPQTFTAGDVSGTGLIKVTDGLIGLDTNTYLTAETDPVFSQWLIDTPPLYSETDPVYSASSWFTTTNNFGLS